MNDDFMCFNDLRYSGDSGLREIAKVLRAGSPSETFLYLLANHLDPDVESSVTGAKLVIKRSKSNHPGAKPNYELRFFIHTHRFIFGEKYAAVRNAAMKKFGVGSTTFNQELKVVEKFVSRDPDFEMKKTSAQTLREQGDAKFAPLR